MIDQCLSLARSKCADTVAPYEFTDDQFTQWFRDACFDVHKKHGSPAADILKFNFIAYKTEDPTDLDESKYENESNISIDKYLYLTDNSKIGYIETKSLNESDRLAMVKITANAIDGSIADDVTFDISLDKPNTDTTNEGSWLAADGLIATIENDTYIDISELASQYFALKITIKAGSSIKIVDLCIERFRIAENLGDDGILDIACLMAGYAWESRGNKAIQNRNSDITIDNLFHRAQSLRKSVLNLEGDKAIKARVGGQISHYSGKNKYTGRVFDESNAIADGLADGSIASIRGDGTIRRVN